MDYNLINKYLIGIASEAEVQEIFRWIDSDPENRNEFIQYKKISALTSNANRDERYAWESVSSKLDKSKVKKRTFMRYWAVAASFLIFFGLGATMQFLFFQKPYNLFSYSSATKIEVPAGQMTNVQLPDGTTVILNSESKLVYANDFNSGNRTVSIEGEAYFVVAKDKFHPFLIKTKKLDFKVYGTSFNIQAYPHDQMINTTLVEGSLGIVGKNGDELTKLVPGENAKFNKQNNSLEVSNVSLDLYTSWKDGLVTFRNEKLKDIARKIERWYNVEIQITNEKLGEEPYMGTIMKNKPIDQILEVFSLTSSLKYRIISRADKPTLIYWE